MSGRVGLSLQLRFEYLRKPRNERCRCLEPLSKSARKREIEGLQVLADRMSQLSDKEPKRLRVP